MIAKTGNHRAAQAFAKNWDRKMKKQAVNPNQKADRSNFLSNFKDVYSNIGQADKMQQMSQNQQFSSNFVQPQQQMQI